MMRNCIVIIVALAFVLSFSNISIARGPCHGDDNSDSGYFHDPEEMPDDHNGFGHHRGPGDGTGPQYSFEITSIDVIVDIVALPFLIVTNGEGDQIIVFVVRGMHHLDEEDSLITEGDELILTGVEIGFTFDEISSFFIAFNVEN